MGRTRTASSTTVLRPKKKAATADQGGEPLGLEFVGLGLALAAVLLIGALATLAPLGARGGMVNVVGSLGHEVADSMTRALGLGTWVLPLFLLAWGIQCLRGNKPERFQLRFCLLPVLMALVSIASALLLQTSGLPGLGRSGPGGYFGVALGETLFGVIGRGSGLVVLFGILAVLRLMTDVKLAPAAAWLKGVFSFDEDLVEEAPKPKQKKPSRKKPKAPESEEEDDEVSAEDDGEWEYEYEDEGDEEGEWEEDEEPESEDEGEWEYEYDEEGEEEYEEEEAEEAPAPPPPKPAPAVIAPPPRKRRRKMLSRGEYEAPPLDMLEYGEQADAEVVKQETDLNVGVLEETLASFGVEARVVSTQRGPVITFFEIKVPTGIRLNKVTALSDDLAIALKAPSIRIVAPIPGKSTVGIEVPNLSRDMVRMRELLEEAPALESKAIPIILGRDTAGRPIVEDLAKMPHLLIAGATGSGKSVCINSILMSMLYTRSPEELQLILVDPKQVELSFFEGIPHLLTPVVTNMGKAAKILEWAVERMEERYAQLLAAGVRNINGYNNLSKERIEKARERHHMDEEDLPDRLSYLVIVVDELADLMLTSGKDVELSITRLCQKSRAVGIHVVLATQRPSTNVITGLIKANMPTRISFVVSSKIDSRVILDANGADKLLGMGDMLYMHPRSLQLRRAQGTFVTDEEARDAVDYLKEKHPAPEYEDLLAPKNGALGDPLKEDELYNDAVRAVLTSNLGSASMLQRRLGVGYTRASRLIDMMCDRQVVGPHQGSKAREVLVTLDEWEAQLAAIEGRGPKASEAFDPEDPPCVDESWD